MGKCLEQVFFSFWFFWILLDSSQIFCRFFSAERPLRDWELKGEGGGQVSSKSPADAAHRRETPPPLLLLSVPAFFLHFACKHKHMQTQTKTRPEESSCLHFVHKQSKERNEDCIFSGDQMKLSQCARYSWKKQDPRIQDPGFVSCKIQRNTQNSDKS